MIKRLVIFILTLKILVLASAQTIINEDNIPTLLKNDTIIIKGEIWVQSVDSEISQRGKIVFYKRKLDRLHHIMHKKQGFESEIDSLVLLTDSLLVVSDSLATELLFALEKESGKIVSKLVTVSARLERTREQYFIVRDKLKTSRNRKLLLIGVIIVEGVIVVLLI